MAAEGGTPGIDGDFGQLCMKVWGVVVEASPEMDLRLACAHRPLDPPAASCSAFQLPPLPHPFSIPANV